MCVCVCVCVCVCDTQEAAKNDHTEVVRLMTEKGGCIYEEDKVCVSVCTRICPLSMQICVSAVGRGSGQGRVEASKQKGRNSTRKCRTMFRQA